MNSKNEKMRFADHCDLNENLKYSGLYIDLCGMSVKDYIEAGKCQCCCCDNNGGENETTKKSNLLTLTTNADGFLMAYLNYSPTEPITVNCVCEGTNVEFVLNNSGIYTSNVVPTSEMLVVSNVTFTPNEDEKYKYGEYKVMNNTSSDTIIYSIDNLLNFSNIDSIKTLTKNDFKSSILSNNNVVLTFKRDADTEYPEGFDEYTDEEYESWREKNSYIPLIIVDKNKFSNGEINIYMGSDKLTDDFSEIENLVIDGITYSILVHRSTSELDQYLTYKGTNILTYAADANTNLEYIIK